jgi:lycopene beta-cyclase
VLDANDARGFDALVIGSGPAGMMIASALAEQGLRVQALTATPFPLLWPNTYGIWRDELEPLGLAHLLEHSWSHCTSSFSKGDVKHDRTYGFFDKAKLQEHFLGICEQFQVVWQVGAAQSIEHHASHSEVTIAAGDQTQTLKARIVIDATGHRPVFVQRDQDGPIAYQAAYGIVGRFSKPPVEDGQLVLMDFQSDHLSEADRSQNPPTFLYAMGFGNGLYFVEETSLASAPALGFDLLERRLRQRLESRGIEVLEEQHIERCLFPMTSPMPRFDQPVLAFGGAATMVHPASGYSIGAQLRRAPDLARSIATALKNKEASPYDIAQAGWKGLWDDDRLRRYYLYRFGLEKLMRFDEVQLKHFFETFFALETAKWSGFLADGLTTIEVVGAMLQLFAKAPNDVRWGLMQFLGKEALLFWRFLTV